MAAAVTQVESGSHLRALVRHAAVAGIAGVVSGIIVGGLGGRLVMRVAGFAAPDRVTGIRTENGNRVGDITTGGTLELVIFIGLFTGILGAILYLATEPWLDWTGRWRGLAFGLVLLAAAGHMVIVPGNVDFAILRNDGLNVGMFLSLFVGFGLLMVWLRSLFDARFPRVDDVGPAFVGYLALLVIGALVVPGLVAQYYIEDSCGCEPAPLLGAFVIAMGLSTVVLWLLWAIDRANGPGVPLLRFGGYLMLAGTVLAGAVRLVSDVREIV